MDRLGNIEAFVEAAEQGSFTKAAKRLRLSPSALSRRVAQLEQRVGVPLFLRTTRAMRLSEDGQAFFERARRALRELEEAHAGAARLRDQPAGRLRVEAPTLIGRHVVVAATAKMVARYPELEIELILRDQPADLASDGIDVSVRLGALRDSGLIGRNLGHTRMRLCAAPRYLRREGWPRTVADLARHERLGFVVDGRVLPWRFREDQASHEGIREVPPGSRLVVNDADALIALTLGGAGLAWMCDFMAANLLETGQLVELLSDASSEARPLHALSLPGRHVLPKVRVFVELLRTELGKRGIA